MCGGLHHCNDVRLLGITRTTRRRWAGGRGRAVLRSGLLGGTGSKYGTLLASHTIGVRGLPAYMPHLSSADCWGSDPLGDVFHHIVCITGFVPIAPPLDFLSPSTSGSVSDHTLFASVDSNGQRVKNETDTREDEEKSGARVSDDQPIGRVSEAFPAPSQQYSDARILARRRVYDMRYL